MKKILIAMAAVCTASVLCAKTFTLALQAYTFKDRSMIETIEVAKRLGFQAIELTNVQKIGGPFQGKVSPWEMAKEIRPAVKAYLDGCGVKAVSYGVIGAQDEKGWREVFDFAQDLGIARLLVEPRVEVLPLLDKLAQEYKIRVAIHNHGPNVGWTTSWCNPEFAAGEISKRSDWFGSGADVGHWRLAKIDAAAGIRTLLKSRIFSLHFVDVDENAHPVPFGKGLSQLDTLLKEMRAANVYPDLIIEYEQWDEKTEANVKACVDWFNAHNKE